MFSIKPFTNKKQKSFVKMVIRIGKSLLANYREFVIKHPLAGMALTSGLNICEQFFVPYHITQINLNILSRHWHGHGQSDFSNYDVQTDKTI